MSHTRSSRLCKGREAPPRWYRTPLRYLFVVLRHDTAPDGTTITWHLVHQQTTTYGGRRPAPKQFLTAGSEMTQA